MTRENRRKPRSQLLIWRRHWRQAWAQAWQLLWEKPLESVLTLLVMALAALPAAVLWLASEQLQGVELQSQGDWVVFTRTETSDTEARALAEALRKEDGVQTVTVLSPETVLQQYLQDTAVEAGLQQMAAGIFPWVLEVRATPGLSVEKSTRMAVDWQQHWPQIIDQVDHDPVWQALRMHLARFLTRSLLWVSLFSVVILFFVVSNTVHLRLRRHQAAIEVMQVLGASNAYLRRPYLLASMLGGLLAGLLTVLLLALILLSLSRPWHDLQQGLGLPPFELRLAGRGLWLWPLLLAGLSLLSARISLQKLRSS